MHASVCRAIVGIPLLLYWNSNALPLPGKRTVSDGQFDWGGRLPKRNGGAQRSAQNGRQPFAERKSTSGLDCEAHKPSRDESRF